MKTNKIFTLTALILTGLGVSLATLPVDNKSVETIAATDINDYSACETAHNSHNASSMLTELRKITAPGHAGSYGQLWETYKTAYIRADGKIFDYYSNTTNYRPGTDQAGSYSEEGDVYNREHSIPKSWWGGAESNQGADPFIVVPTDGYVNNIRSNYPMGPVENATYQSNNNFSKLGSVKSGYGYSGTVFEPDDSVKGDFARIVFYAIAKYSGSSGWTKGDGDSTFSGSENTNFGLTNYAVKFYSEWSALDPVSDWERSVNDKIADIQGNRNPFIDHPEYANTLWGTNSNYTPYPEESKTLTSISISNPKTSYEVDDGFVKPTVTAYYDDSSSKVVSGSTTFTGYDLSKTGNYTVTASYTEGGVTKTATYSITVTASTKTLISISVSNPKTSFGVGNPFTFGGTVTAVFSNSTQADVTSVSTFTGYNMSQEGNQTVTVSYTYGGVAKIAQYQISVSAGGGQSATIDETFTYDDMSNWSVSNSTVSSYILCPVGSNDSSVALMPGLFTDKTVTSAIVITINTATYGTGNTPTANTYSVYNSEACTTQVSAIQSGTLPTSSTYTDVIYTVSLNNASAFVDDLAIKIVKPGRQIRIKTIKVEFDYETSGTVEPITGITASVKNDKTFYVGETITAADILVKDSNNQTVTDFSFDNYQFKYSDSIGGAMVRTIYLEVSYQDYSCELEVNVQRKAYITPVESSLVHTGAEFKTGGIGTSYKTNQTATVDGITFKVDGYVYQSSKLSLSESQYSAPGKVINTTPYPSGITNVTVDGASPDIQLSVDGNTWVNKSSAQTSTINYYYLKIYYQNTSQSNYRNINSFAVTLKGQETPENVANYIMYEDTANQCVNKLDIAMLYFGNLSPANKTIFETYNDYVIQNGRERLEAWAANQGKTINYSTGELSNKVGVVQYGVEQENPSAIIIIVSAMSVVSLSVLLIIKKKRLHN